MAGQTARKPAGKPKKRRITGPDGKFQWIPVESDATPPPEAEADEGAPEAPEPPAPPREFPIYYHAYLPNLAIHRGRSTQIKFRGGIFQPRTEQQEARVRKALRKYVPGRNPDRWMGDNSPRELRSRECGFFTSNFEVMVEHLTHTKH